VKGLNALLAIVSTPASAPVIAAARLRKGSTNSARGAARFVTDALMTATKSGASGVLVLRADSAYYGHDVIAAALRRGARFSITARQDKAVRRTIASIAPEAWTTISYTNAVYDQAQQRWISNAEVAEIPYTAFTSKPKAQHVTARLLVRRVIDMNPNNQSELFTAYRYHAVFTNSPLPMLEAEKAHRAHAIVEQVIADLKNGPLAHLPSDRAGLPQPHQLRHQVAARHRRLPHPTTPSFAMSRFVQERQSQVGCDLIRAPLQVSLCLHMHAQPHVHRQSWPPAGSPAPGHGPPPARARRGRAWRCCENAPG